MNKRFAIKFNADAPGGGGGSETVSATMTAPAQSEVAGSQTSAPVYDDAYFVELGNKVDNEGYEPSEAEITAYVEHQTKAKQAPNKPEPTAAKKEEVKQATDVKDPKGEIDVEKLVAEGKFNQWTAEESAAVEKAMAKVGAKSPRELLEKVDGALSLAGKKGGEAGELAKANQQLQEELASFKALQADLAAGKPEAIRYLQDNFGLTLAQAKAEANKAANPQGDSNPTMPEGVIDTETYGIVTRMQQEFNQKISEMGKQLQEFQTAEQNRKAEEQKRIETERRQVEIRQVRNEHIDSLIAVAEQDPATYGVKSANLRELLTKYYETGKPDPRIQNHIELMKFAVENKLPSLTTAFKLKNADRLSQLIIEAEQRGRDSVLKVGSPQSLSGLRSGSNEGQNPQSYSNEDISAMERGDLAMPKEWFVNGLLQPSKVPEQLRERIFGRK